MTDPAMRSLLATVVVLTYNGERYLRELLDAVTRQRIDG